MMVELIYKDLSYKIIGIIFEVFNELGYGYQEKYYQRAIALALGRKKLKYIKEKEVKLTFRDHPIGKYFIDFVIENKVVLELKVANEFYSQDTKQVLGYLKSSGLQLGILALITKDDVRYKRLVNIRNN